MKKKRVFVVHLARRRVGNEFVPLHDISSASEFGDIVELFGQSRLPMYDGEALMVDIEKKLSSHKIDDEDSLLLIGDPLAIAISSIVASRLCSRINFLKWDRRSSRYIRFKVRLPK